jgi:hypothetical protein
LIGARETSKTELISPPGRVWPVTAQAGRRRKKLAIQNSTRNGSMI